MGDFDWVFARIRDYAIEHELSPEQVKDCFMAGAWGALILRPDWPYSQRARAGTVEVAPTAGDIMAMAPGERRAYWTAEKARVEAGLLACREAAERDDRVA